MSKHLEIAKLQHLRSNHDIEITVTEDFLCGRVEFPGVLFSLDSRKFTLYIDDEFGDSKIDNPDLNLCLVLRALEDYDDAEDYLAWCRQLDVDPSDLTARQHHLELATIYREVELLIGPIDSFVNDFDFELNAGAAQALRNSKNS